MPTSNDGLALDALQSCPGRNGAGEKRLTAERSRGGQPLLAPCPGIRL